MTPFTRPDEGCAHPATRDRATRATHQAATRLDHTASVPCAWTPGPWRVENKDESACFNIVAGQDYFSREFVAFTGATIEAAEANARLIAAAPELYRALDQLHRETLLFLKREGKDVGKTGPGRALYEMVERALAKARGEHS